MIVRISGLGQYELDDGGVHRLHELDAELTEAIHGSREADFHRLLHETISFIQKSGKELSHETMLPSDVIVPPDDVSLEEAKRFFTDEGLMAPILA
jgi:hypothetical protein